MTSPANELPNAAVDTQISALNGSRKSAPVDITKGYLRNYFLDQAYDEMFDADGNVRPHYRLLLDTFSGLPEEELARRKHSADISFRTQGITFTVYGNQEGTERIFPYDMLPRIITGAEWDRIERGLIQRITALNLFLGDVYNDGKILRDGFVPREIVYSFRIFVAKCAACKFLAMSISRSQARTCCA